VRTLFAIRGFLPYIIILLINATVDIAHKITIQNVLLKSYSGETLVILSAVINALILLPFILLFSPSGYLSDKYAKTRVVRYAALSSIALAVMILVSYALGWFWIAFGMTFLLAVQSAIYSPAKYGLIKELVGVEHLGSANGLVQAITIVAILASSILFSVIFESIYGGAKSAGEILPNLTLIGWLLIALTSLESYLAYKLPVFEPGSSAEHFSIRDYLRLSYLRKNVMLLRSNRDIWLSIFALGIFWGIGQIVVAAFPAHYKAIMGDDNAIVIQSILAVSAIGVMVGSLLAGRASREHIEHGIIPLGATGLFGSLLLFGYTTQTETMYVASLLFGFFGGLFIVPLNATIQFFAAPAQLGTILAGNNFIQNIIMVLFLVLSIVLVEVGFDTETIFGFAAAITLIGSLYAARELPNLFVRILLIPILHTRYKLRIKGLSNLPQSGGVLLLGNHISWIDWLILQIASPRAIKFVMEKSIYNKWYLRWFLQYFRIIPISSASGKDSITKIRERLNNGEVVALFPEGRISYNGQLNEFKKGFEMAMRELDHPIVPFYLHGLWGSTFSRANDYYQSITDNGSKRELVVAFGEPMKGSSSSEEVKEAVVELSRSVWEEEIDAQRPLQYSWIRRARSQLFRKAIVDTTGANLNNLKLITGVLIFIKKFRTILDSEKNAGVLLPSSAAGSIVNLALLILGRRPVNLNYTLSKEALLGAIEKAGIQRVITSQKFLDKLAAKGFDLRDTLEGRTIVLETLSGEITKAQRIKALLQSLLLPAWLLEKLYFEKVTLDDTATILFSSGSEGTPKGIELTHKNLMANIRQVSSLLNFQNDDVILNSLPIFHSFGLTVTTLLPLCEGVTIASAPDPTDAVAIGRLAARERATILFGTSTFFRLYERNRKLHPLMFESIRMVVAGAEKLKPEVRKAFREKFGLDIYEGYGATETSPVISVNMPNRLDLDTMQPIIGNKEGSVGQGIPGTIIRIVDPETLAPLPRGEDGLIIVGGSQVMQGYLDDKEQTDEAIVEIEGIRYYRTGDKGHLDEDGFVYIVDRYSRFAKIGGEMISLGSVEEKLAAILGEGVEFVTTAVEDARKGEQVVLLYRGDITTEKITAVIKESDLPPIMQPGRIYNVEELPKLGSGKNDYKRAKKMALELTGS